MPADCRIRVQLLVKIRAFFASARMAARDVPHRLSAAAVLIRPNFYNCIGGVDPHGLRAVIDRGSPGRP
jgi:hypothetical protein